jgi:polyisoprenoid-binding protein YceI
MRNRPWLKWVLIGVGTVLVLVVAVPFVYINFIKKDAPPKLSLSDVPTETTAPSASSTADPPDDSSIDGTYKISDGSQAGYRAKEVLFGQSATAAGRTSDVTGEAVISGTTVSKADFTVGLATVKSDEDRRDQQFQGRIMDVADFPTATFTLTQPIELQSIPALNQEVKVSATGNFTLRGVTKSVTFELTASRKGSDTIAVQGDIPITWSEWSIPEPSFGPAQVVDNGEIEFLLVLTR